MVYNLDGEKPPHVPQETWGRLKETFDKIYNDEDGADNGE